jgi:hypothetical protein
MPQCGLEPLAFEAPLHEQVLDFGEIRGRSQGPTDET